MSGQADVESCSEPLVKPEGEDNARNACAGKCPKGEHNAPNACAGKCRLRVWVLVLVTSVVVLCAVPVWGGSFREPTVWNSTPTALRGVLIANEEKTPTSLAQEKLDCGKDTVGGVVSVVKDSVAVFKSLKDGSPGSDQLKNIGALIIDAGALCTTFMAAGAAASFVTAGSSELAVAGVCGTIAVAGALVGELPPDEPSNGDTKEQVEKQTNDTRAMIAKAANQIACEASTTRRRMIATVHVVGDQLKLAIREESSNILNKIENLLDEYMQDKLNEFALLFKKVNATYISSVQRGRIETDGVNGWDLNDLEARLDADGLKDFVAKLRGANTAERISWADLQKSSMAFVNARVQTFAIRMAHCLAYSCAPEELEGFAEKFRSDMLDYSKYPDCDGVSHRTVEELPMTCFTAAVFQRDPLAWTTVSGNLRALHPSAEYLNFGNNKLIVGGFADVPRSAKFLNFTGSNVGGTTAELPKSAISVFVDNLTGPVADLPPNLKDFWMLGNSRSLSGSVGELPRSLESIELHVPADLTSVSSFEAPLCGDFADLPRLARHIVVEDFLISGHAADLPRGAEYLRLGKYVEARGHGPMFWKAANFDGDLKDLPKSVTSLEVVCGPGNTATGRLEDLPPNLTFVRLVGWTEIQGLLSDLPRGAKIIYITGNERIYGSTSDLPPAAEEVYIPYAHIFGELRDVPRSLTTFWCDHNSDVHGSLADLPPRAFAFELASSKRLERGTSDLPPSLCFFEGGNVQVRYYSAACYNAWFF